MGDSRFLLQPGEIREPGRQHEVIGYFELLDMLGVFDAPRDRQVAAVSSWLDRNTPCELLAGALEDEGYDVRRRGGLASA